MGVSIFANEARITPRSTVYELCPVLASSLALVARATRVNRRSRALARDRTLQLLIADLVAARTVAGMTQQEVARKMGTTKSAICKCGCLRQLFRFRATCGHSNIARKCN